MSENPKPDQFAEWANIVAKEISDNEALAAWSNVCRYVGQLEGEIVALRGKIEEQER